MGLPGQGADCGDDLTTGILPIVRGLIATEPNCNVVDLGVGAIGNCALLSANGARVFIDTTPDSLRARVLRREDIDSREIAKLIARFPQPIDVILFWDLLNYLSLDKIEELMKQLSEVMRPGGLAYVMLSRQRHIPATPAVIDFVSEDLLRFHYNTALKAEAPQYAPKKLEQRMPGFVLEKLYLLQNGVQEHLFLFEGLD